jgi:hypothetical protein
MEWRRVDTNLCFNWYASTYTGKPHTSHTNEINMIRMIWVCPKPGGWVETMQLWFTKCGRRTSHSYHNTFRTAWTAWRGGMSQTERQTIIPSKIWHKWNIDILTSDSVLEKNQSLEIYHLLHVDVVLLTSIMALVKITK